MQRNNSLWAWKESYRTSHEDQENCMEGFNFILRLQFPRNNYITILNSFCLIVTYQVLFSANQEYISWISRAYFFYASSRQEVFTEVSRQQCGRKVATWR